jgi:hypothetical protein
MNIFNPCNRFYLYYHFAINNVVRIVSADFFPAI